jgi:rare lipoprotein A
LSGPRSRLAAALACAAFLAGCGSPIQRLSPFPAPAVPKRKPSAAPELPAANSGRGGYYLDDGPGDAPPDGLHEVPDAEVRDEPILPRANRPYVVFGKTYVPMKADSTYAQRGVASWYGKKFHGRKTSSGEIYDMYKMTAAHPTLPIPSYVRVRSLVSGKSVVVRVNDRGPFHASRIIDLSYTAALRIGLLGAGSHEVEVERLFPGQTELWARRRNAEPIHASADVPQAAALMLEGRDQKPAAEPAPPGSYYLQVGAYSNESRANEVRQRLQKHGGALSSLAVVRSGSLYRLYLGPFGTRTDALTAEESIPSSLHLKPVVVRR